MSRKEPNPLESAIGAQAAQRGQVSSRVEPPDPSWRVPPITEGPVDEPSPPSRGIASRFDLCPKFPWSRRLHRDQRVAGICDYCGCYLET